MRTDHLSDLLTSAHATLTAEEALRQRPGVLLGVSAEAQTTLETLDLRSVFDLAASRVFATATRLLAAHRDPTSAEARLNAVPADAVDPPPGIPASELATQPIAILKGIGAERGAQIAAALDVVTVRDLALWRPYLAAKAILDSVFFPERRPDFDPDAPPDLLPRSGDYPTERIFFKKLLIDAAAPAQATTPLEQAPPIDLGLAFAAPIGFPRMATGGLLTFSQSWFSEGLTLGQLLHSTSLAPGESTRIAMIDWSRRTRAATTEEISETERLANTMDHSRSISEVTNATAQEFQTGASQTSSSSESRQSGGGFGLDFGIGGIGGSSSSASSTTEAMSVSSSFGTRDLAASYAQQINDRSQQNASSVRNRRASIVREVSQEEHEQISTRVVTNYNHMHALSIQYYEVVQAFRVTTQLERAERCLFVPLQLLDFNDAAVVDRWRSVLAEVALTLSARRQLTVEYGVVEIIPLTPRVTPGRIVVTSLVNATRVTRAADGAGPAARDGDASEAPDVAVSTPWANGSRYDRGPANSTATVLAVKGWDVDQLNRLGWSTGRVTVRQGSDSVFVSDEALVLGFALEEGQALRFQVRRRDAGEVVAQEQTPTAYLFREPVPLAELLSISVQNGADRELKTSLVLHLNVAGTVMPLDVPIALKPGGATSRAQECVRFGGVRAARDLMDHLEANRLYYSQAVFRTLDSATLAAVLARYTYRSLPLVQLVDQPPVAVTANCLVFRVNVPTEGEPEDAHWAAEQAEWKRWLARRGLERPVPRSEIIPLPSGGVFAEAVLGRFNAAEKIDLKRFWNWQDSPIPLTASEIAPIQAGSRAEAEDLKPGQLSAPMVNIQTPTALPEPTGLAAILTAIQNGNMFRDMSGLAQTTALAQAALQATAAGATAAGQQAGQNLKTVVDATTERMRIAGQLLSGMTASGGASPPGKGTVTERGGELNEARTIDAQRAERGAEGVHTTDIPPAVFAADSSGAATEAPRTTYEDIFRDQAAGPAGQIKNLLAAILQQGGGAGAGSGSGSVQSSLTWTVQVTCEFLILGPLHAGGDDTFSDGDIRVVLKQYDIPNGTELVVWDSGYTTPPSNTIRSSRHQPPKYNLLDIEAWVRFANGWSYLGVLPFYPSGAQKGTSLDVTLALTVHVQSKHHEQTVSATDIDAAAAAVRAFLIHREHISEKMIFAGLYSDVGGGSFKIELDYFTGKIFVEVKP